MEQKDLLKHIAELEARLITTENYLINIVALNDLKLPDKAKIDQELTYQRGIAQKKYLGGS